MPLRREMCNLRAGFVLVILSYLAFVGPLASSAYGQVQITCPANVTIECDQSTDPASTGTAVATGGVAPITITYADATTPGTCAYDYTITRTWTATDDVDDQASCIQIIEVEDTTPPEVTCPLGCPPVTIVSCIDDVPPCDPTLATAIDNCDPDVTIVCYRTDNGGSGCVGDTLIITDWFIAKDECGNAASCARAFKVVDDVPPEITCPLNSPPLILVQCVDEIPPCDPLAATAIDNCGGTVTITCERSDDGGAGCEADPLFVTDLFTATDNCGNTATCTRTFKVVDDTPPEVTCPPEITVQCPDDAPPPDIGLVVATDNCDPSPVITHVSDVPDGQSCPTTIIRTYRATDFCGNSAECTQTIYADDTEPPTLIDCPGDITVECDAIPPPAEVSAVDNCVGITITFGEQWVENGPCANTGTLLRTWTATDACENEASCTQTITVVDTTPPVLSGCPADITVECDQIPAPPEVTATDNCNPSPTVTFEQTVSYTGCAPYTGLITRTWTATDECGNEASCSQTITVVDTTPPDLTGCPADITIECDQPIPDPANVTASDNCDVSPTVSLNEVTDLSDCGGYTGTITRTWTASDICDNQSTCSQVITIIDSQSPALTGPGNQNHHWAAGLQILQASISDNCAQDFTATITADPPLVNGIDYNLVTRIITYVPECSDIGGSPHVATLHVEDPCGNPAEWSFEITITDTPPFIACPSDILLWYSYEGEIRASVAASDVDGDPVTVGILATTKNGDPFPVPPGMVIENNGGWEFVWDPDWADEGEWVVTLEVDDGCLQTTCSFLINVLGKFQLCVTDTCVLPGLNADIFVTSTNSPDIGGFDLLLNYDPSGMQLLGAIPWGDLTLWEYFTYRTGDVGSCGDGGCPSGLIRVLGMVNMFDAATPPPEAFSPDGSIIKLTFATTSDRSFIGQCFNVGWIWYDCGDNSISSVSGDTSFVAQEIVEFLPDGDCLAGDKGFVPLPRIDFCNGAVCICPPADDRGDINLNGLANEVADAVLFINYMLYGPHILGYGIDDWYENRVLATDVNDDGYVLSISDLVYLIRIITGDAEPFPNSGEGGPMRLAPVTDTGTEAYVEHGGDVIRVHLDSPLDLGAVALTLDVDGLAIGGINATSRSSEMTVRSHLDDGELRILVYSMSNSGFISRGAGAVVEIPIAAEGSIELTDVEASDRAGREVGVQLHSKAPVPQVFELLQNYPNPFNASTVIKFRLPEVSAWNLAVYDVAGRLVRTYTGTGEPGEIQINWDGQNQNGDAVASGIYFYRVTASSFIETRKMVLVK